MPRNKKFTGDMTAIGRARTPSLARLPDIHTLFAGRHRRFEQLKPTSPVADYIGFLSIITAAQQQTADTFACHPFAAAGERVYSSSAPPLDRAALAGLPVLHDIMEDFLTRVEKNIPNPAVKQALVLLRNNGEERADLVKRLAGGAAVADRLAESLLVMASLQVLMALATHTLDVKKLQPLPGNCCPACGGAHASSMLVNWPEAEGMRYCSCLYCGTLWHYVRIKCTFCEATGGIEYREIEGGPGSVLAETCKSCGSYCKQVDHQKDAAMDAFADDIGSIALDLMLRDNGIFHRGAFNPFMAGY